MWASACTTSDPLCAAVEELLLLPHAVTTNARTVSRARPARPALCVLVGWLISSFLVVTRSQTATGVRLTTRSLRPVQRGLAGHGLHREGPDRLVHDPRLLEVDCMACVRKDQQPRLRQQRERLERHVEGDQHVLVPMDDQNGQLDLAQPLTHVVLPCPGARLMPRLLAPSCADPALEEPGQPGALAPAAFGEMVPRVRARERRVEWSLVSVTRVQMLRRVRLLRLIRD